MNILEDYKKIEELLFSSVPSELLDLQYSAYAFGSGLVAFHAKGKNIKVIHDGRDNQVEIEITENHVRYPSKEWKTIWRGHANELEKSSTIVKEYLA